MVDATFLTNHDQNRVMSAASLLLTLPGSPYYIMEKRQVCREGGLTSISERLSSAM